MNNPKVIIILVNYNNYKDTIDCIKSLRRVQYPNFHVLIIDNCSTDNSFERLKKEIKKESILLSPTNKGFSNGNNIGIKWALDNGFDYILLLNNDTTVEPDFLDYLILTAESYKGNAIVTSNIYYYDQKETIWYGGGSFNEITGRVVHIGINKKDIYKEKKPQEVSFISGCCMLFSTKIVTDIGYLSDDYFLYCEDLDYCCRARSNGYKLIYNPKSVIYHKVSSSTKKMPRLVGYYLVRNKFIIIRKFIKRNYQLIAKAYLFLECTKRILTNEYSANIVKEAIIDYSKGRFGKKHN